MSVLLVAAVLAAVGSSPAVEGEPLGSLEGRWRLVLSYSVVRAAPLFGAVASRITMVGVVDLAERDGALVQATRVCRVSSDDDEPFISSRLPSDIAGEIVVPAGAVRVHDESVTAALDGIRVGDDDGTTLVLEILGIAAVDIVVRQRLDLLLEGRASAAGDAIWGDVVIEGFRQEILAMRPPLKGMVGRLETEARGGRFRMTRLGASAGCDAV